MGWARMDDTDSTVSKGRAGNMASLIYDELRADILSGKLAQGTPLSQLGIAAAGGTSRGPVREALRRLQQDMLVVAEANKRFSVAPFNIVDLEAVLSLNLANDALAIRISVPFLTTEEMQRLGECVARMDRTVGVDDPGWVDAYHQFIFTATAHASPRVVSLSRQLIDDIRRYRASISDIPSVWIESREFLPIIDAIKARAGALASTRFARLAGRRALLIMDSVSTSYDPFRLRNYVAALASSDATP